MVADEYTVNPQSAFGEVSSETLAADTNSGLAYYKSENKLWKVIGIVSIVVTFIAMILAGYGFAHTYRPPQPKMFSSSGIPISCKQVKGPSGVYYIQTDSYFNKYPVYCDMEVAGGGWTLVAAIHENNMQGKCTVGDRWSSEQGIGNTANYNGSNNWENKNIFGNVHQLAQDDYKNMAYYGLQGKNVMIWHVPNNVLIQNFSSQAFLKYYTTNNFLSKYGGNLQAMYKNYASIVHAGPGRFFTLIAPPVTYVKGNNDTIMNGIPKLMRQFVQPGFVQFRAFDKSGFPNALCPGIRIVHGNSAQVCVGGGGVTRVPGVRLNTNYCGDFAGWGGNGSDPGSQNAPSDTGKSLKDINSSIFIFVK